MEIVKLYLLAWLVWYIPSADNFKEVEDLIKVDLNGIGMRGHRKDLINQLDTVLEDLKAELGLQFGIQSQLWSWLEFDGEQIPFIEEALKPYKNLKEMLLKM